MCGDLLRVHTRNYTNSVKLWRSGKISVAYTSVVELQPHAAYRGGSLSPIFRRLCCVPGVLQAHIKSDSVWIHRICLVMENCMHEPVALPSFRTRLRRFTRRLNSRNQPHTTATTVLDTRKWHAKTTHNLNERHHDVRWERRREGGNG